MNLRTLGCGLSLLACGPPDPAVTSTSTGGGTGSTGVPTTGGGGSDGTSTGGSTAVTMADSDAGDATAGTDSGGALDGCDPWQQDCPEGEKCTIWAADGGNAWNAYRCVPVTGDGQPGEPCTAELSGTSGLDDCQKGTVCWEVDAQLHGACVALCVGTVDMPECADPDTYCDSNNEGVVNVCLPNCDLLLQDCPGDQLCLLFDDSTVCVLEPSTTGLLFDPCEFANLCDKGLVCAASDAASECDPGAAGCCTPFCPLDDPGFVCPGVGQGCVPLYEEGMAPPKLADIGYCAIPE